MPYITHFKSTKGTDEVIHLKNIMVYYYRVEEGVLTFFSSDTGNMNTPNDNIYLNVRMQLLISKENKEEIHKKS